MRPFLLTLLVTCWLALPLPGVTAEDPAQACKDFKLDVTQELKLFGGKARPAVAGASSAAAPVIQSGELMRLSLAPAAKATFALPPGKAAAEGTYAGTVKLGAAKSATVRVSLDGPAWIDVISGGKIIESTRHASDHACQRMRKTVEFSVTPGATLVIQLSGSPRPDIRLAVTYP